MAAPQWEGSVERARLASLKTFEGRLEIARASFEQIPANGKGATHGHTLADFAEEAGIEYGTLRNYRSFAAWWGDCPASVTISYTVAVEAKASGKWKTGEKFVSFIDYVDAEDMPVFTDPSGEYEPYQFTAWTMNALRVHLGRKPNNNLRLTLKEKSGGKVTADEFHAAEALDAVEEAGAEIDQIKSETTKVRTFLSGASDLRSHVDLQSIIEETKGDMSFAPTITDETKALVKKLAVIKQFLDLHGSEKVADPDGGEAETQAELTLDALQAHKGEIDLAFSEVGVGASFDSLLTQ
jgi:hypothetical protein